VLELWHLLHDASTLAETQIMLSVLALIGISSIHLLKTFINVEQHSDRMVFWQGMIHLAFVASAVFLAWIERIVTPAPKAHG